MATATAPAPVKRTHEILETVDHPSDGMRAYRYRWTLSGGMTSEDHTGEGWAHSPLEPMSRDLLDDRWRGLMLDRGDPSKLQDKLDKLLWEIAEGLTRRDMQQDAVIDGEIVGIDVVMEVEALEHVIRDWMIERAAKVASR